jgi:curved DNA-binding protein CbpA
MTPLYELLGVKSSATVKQIRAAYRRKAKKAHPDTGGDAVKFAALKKAHDILIDPERRARYDATGDASEKNPDNSLSRVVGLLAAALESVLQQIERRAGDPVEFEIVSDMKILLGGNLDEIQKQREQLRAARKKTEKLIGRFGVKKGENYLEGIIVGKLSALDTKIRQLDEGEKPIKAALDILTNSSFRSDHGGGQQGHNYGSAYSLADLMGKAVHGAFTG